MKANILTLAVAVMVLIFAADDYAHRTRVDRLQDEVNTLQSQVLSLAKDSKLDSESIIKLAEATQTNNQSIRDLVSATHSNIASIRLLAGR